MAAIHNGFEKFPVPVNTTTVFRGAGPLAGQAAWIFHTLVSRHCLLELDFVLPIVLVIVHIHTVLGPGLLESAYQKCIQYELHNDGFKESLAHTVHECKYHVVFVPKLRRKVIYGRLRQEVGPILRRLCKYRGVGILEGKACIDHIHLCLSIPPKYAVATIVGHIKGKSAMIVFERYSKHKRNFKGHSFWARGYYVSTVGLDEAKIRKYIKDQEINESIVDKYDRDVHDPF